MLKKNYGCTIKINYIYLYANTFKNLGELENFQKNRI